MHKQLTYFLMCLIIISSVSAVSNVQQQVEGNTITFTYDGIPPFSINIRGDTNIGQPGGYLSAKTYSHSFTYDLSFATNPSKTFYYGIHDGTWSALSSITLETANNTTNEKNCSVNGMTIQHNESRIFYQTSLVPFGTSCIEETRTCSDGTLSGTYQYPTCSNKVAKVLLWNLLVDGWEKEGWTRWSDGRNIEAIEVMNNHDPDIMLFQEITSGMYEDINNAFPEYYSHWASSGSGLSSNAIFSKLPMTNKGYFYLHEETERTCPYATINGVEVYSCHMPPPGAANDIERQERELPRRIESRQNIVLQTRNKSNIIIGGDFNTQKIPYDLLIWETIRQEYSACGRQAENAQGVDHIFSSHTCETDEYLRSVQTENISDHPAFIFSIDFNERFAEETHATRDRIRIANINSIRDALALHYEQYGSYTQPESGGSDCSTGLFSTNRYCCDGSDCQSSWDSSSNLQVLINDGHIDILPIDPINNKDYFYRYEPWNEGQSGGTYGGWKFELCAEKFETHVYDTSTKDYTIDRYCTIHSHGD